MKKDGWKLSVILMCCLVSACGGSQEPPFKDGKMDAEVPVGEQQKADETSKIGKGLIITSVVLGAGFVASVLVNLALVWKIRQEKKPIGVKELDAALAVLKEKFPKEAMTFYNALQLEIAESVKLRKWLGVKNDNIKVLTSWMSEVKGYAQRTLASGRALLGPEDKNLLVCIAGKNLRDFATDLPTGFTGFIDKSVIF